MSRDFNYARINGKELSRRLDHLGLGLEDLVRLSGTSRYRATKWVNGEEDIPIPVDLLTQTWVDVPGALEAAWSWFGRVAERSR